MLIPSCTTCWGRVLPGDVTLYFYVNSDGFFLQKGVFPCLWPKCWSLGAGAGSPHMGRGRRSPVLPSGCCGPARQIRTMAGQGGQWCGGGQVPGGRGEGAEPGGRGSLVSPGGSGPSWKEGLFPHAGSLLRFLEWTLGKKRAFWVEEKPYRDTSVGRAQPDSLTG